MPPRFETKCKQALHLGGTKKHTHTDGAGLLEATDSDIVREVLDGKGESADKGPSDSDERLRHTTPEAAHALAILEDICMVSSDSVHGLSCLGDRADDRPVAFGSTSDNCCV